MTTSTENDLLAEEVLFANWFAAAEEPIVKLCMELDSTVLLHWTVPGPPDEVLERAKVALFRRGVAFHLIKLQTLIVMEVDSIKGELLP